MSDLLKQLQTVTDALQKHGPNLDGPVWNKTVATFGKALEKFDSALQASIQGTAPGMRELETLLTKSSDKKLLDESFITKLSKEILGHKPEKTTASKMRTDFLKEIKSGNGSAKKALAYTQDFLHTAKAPKQKLPTKDDEALRREWTRLGGLDDDQLSYEVKNRYSGVSDLKLLAKASGLPLPKGIAKPDLIKLIVTNARRVHSHILYP
ncbi:hypothetical protein FEM03_15530 [Phragmitibacter flavus]|uniref:Uncharacterized protein n=1 Tax=Phragmitibacter flavus TaxID=2576071 RepID=A0A5R8KBW9_9BACT|nr:hypothetical protein [Phragmitibacter flavus]TLD69737.1 hypothetical protein FEM03_15530 [Phragmitibacter flavus]